MSYESALEAAGAKVLAFESFGDYQGTWLAKVDFNGEVGWTEGSYGSCSGCDAFEGEFGWAYEESENFQERLKLFGLSYLQVITPQEQQEKYHEDQCKEKYQWEDNQGMLDFVKANK